MSFLYLIDFFFVQGCGLETWCTRLDWKTKSSCQRKGNIHQIRRQNIRLCQKKNLIITFLSMVACLLVCRQLPKSAMSLGIFWVTLILLPKNPSLRPQLADLIWFGFYSSHPTRNYVEPIVSHILKTIPSDSKNMLSKTNFHDILFSFNFLTPKLQLTPQGFWALNNWEWRDKPLGKTGGHNYIFRPVLSIYRVMLSTFLYILSD